MEDQMRQQAIETVEFFQRVAMGLIPAVLATGVAAIFISNRIGWLLDFEGGIAHQTLTVSRLALIVLWVILVLQWFQATGIEYRIWKEHLSYAIVRSQAILSMLALAISLAVMFFFIIYDILWFSVFYAFFLLLNYWGQWNTNEACRKALINTRRRILVSGSRDDSTTLDQIDKKKQLLKVIEDYWLRRPQLGRINLMMFLAWVAVVIALRGKSASLGSRIYYELAATLLILLIIGVGELWIDYWRKKRGDAFDAITKDSQEPDENQYIEGEF